MSPTFRPNASAIALMFSPTGRKQADPAARARADRDRPHVHVRQLTAACPARRRRSSRSRRCLRGRRRRAPRAGRARGRPRSPPAPTVPVIVAPASTSPAPITTRPVIGSSSSAASIPENADSSALSWSARPSQRAPASAARSVARRYVSHMQKLCSGVSAAAWVSAGSSCGHQTLANRSALLSDELHDGSDRELDVAVLDHGNTCPPRLLDDELLDQPDVRQRVEVLVDRPEAVGARVAHPEVRRVHLLLLDREHAVDDQRALDLAGSSRARGARPRARATIPPGARARSPRARRSARSASARRTIRARRGARRSSGTSKLERWIEGMKSCGRNARIVWRTKSVELTRVIPSR